MCGFAGVVSWSDQHCISPDMLRRMTDAIAHRGPDGRGEYISPDLPRAAMGFCRLAILDPDPRSNQPFSDDRFTLVFNGEIYNFRELRQELTTADPNYAWRTTGDTEVLLRSFAVWNDRCLDKLNGMYALAVWDRVEKKLFLARDRMGQKPLYIALAPGSTGGSISAIAFASEAPALLQLPWIDRRIDENALVEYFRWGCVPPGMSIYTNLRQLPPGTYAQADARGFTIHTYFRPTRFSLSPAPPCVSDEQAVEQTRRLVRSAVRRQLVSDVPLGCFLSGGIDSSVITAAAVAELATTGQQLKTFSIGFDDPRYDESEYALGVATYLRTDHARFIVRPDAAADLPRLARAFGEPFGDSSALPTFYLSRETRQHVKVALSGDGGDELFAGYDRYRALRMLAITRRFTTRLPWLPLAALAARWSNGHPKSTHSRLQRMIRATAQPPGKDYASLLRLMDDPFICRLLKRDPITLSADRVAEEFTAATAVEPPLHAAMYVDRTFYLPADLLTKVDRASMQFNLEVRSPFMDHELVGFADALTTRQLVAGGAKRMLRLAFSQELPTWVFQRRKMGFAVPIGDWLRNELRDLLRDTLASSKSFTAARFDMNVLTQMIEEHQTGRRDHSQRLYAILMLELWWQNA